MTSVASVPPDRPAGLLDLMPDPFAPCRHCQALGVTHPGDCDRTAR